MGVGVVAADIAMTTVKVVKACSKRRSPLPVVEAEPSFEVGRVASEAIQIVQCL